MNRSCISALISLACLSTLPALAQSSGSAEPFVTLSVGANPTAGGVSLTGTVQPDAAGNTRRPSGTVTFLDGTTVLNANGAALAANPNLVSQTFAQVFGAPDPQMVGVFDGELAADFDGDGKNDLLWYGQIDTQGSVGVQLFLSSNPGQGNFRVLPRQFLDSPLLNLPPAALDVNGDGKLDLLFGNVVAYGNGDGTFSRTAVLPVLATGFDQTYAVDVNGDGKLDIVAVNTPPQPSNSGPAVQYMFTVFRNDGNGTFTSLGSFPLAAPVQPGQDLCCDLYIIFALNFGDVNGDDKLDVLSQSAWVPGGNAAAPNNLNVMLNNGDGTFGAVKAVDASALGSLNIDGVAFGDLDSDGKQDLILAYANFSGRNFLGAALGNGDGTFGSFFQLQLINYITGGIQSPQVQLTEANGDGKLDAILGSGELALGNGDGTFSLSTPLFPQPPNPQTPLNYPLLQMPIYAHSLPSLVYLNLTGGANAVFTPQDSSSANVSVALSPGAHTLTAHYSGDSTYAAGDSAPVTITVAPAASTVTVTSSANPSYTGENVTFTATIAGFLPNPLVGTSTVTFSDGTTTLGTSPVSGGLATITTSLSSVGSHTITAAYSGDANNAASSGTVTQTVDAPVTVGGGGSGGSTSLTVASGQSVTTQVAVSGNAGFSGTVNLSCTGLPVHASCSFSPDSVTVSDKTASAAMTISTSATTTAKSQVGEAARAVTVLACGLPLLGLIMLIPVARGRRLLLCASFLLFVSAAGPTGCGGGSSSDKTAAGSYTFQVVATAGAASSTANYTLKVQ